MMMMDYHFDFVNDESLEQKCLQKYSQEELFSLAFGDITQKKYFTNPLREDNKPGCWFEYNGKYLYFKDFAFGNKPLNVFEFLSLYYNIDKEDLYKKILLSEIKPNIKVKKRMSKIKKINKDEITEIIPKITKWTKTHIEYWKQYLLTKNDLESEFISPISGYYQNDNYYGEFDLAFVYFEGDCITIYKPNSENRFVTNCMGNKLLGTFNKEEKYLIITKSRKDYIVLKKAGFNTAYLRAESLNPNIDEIKNFDYVFIGFDNDKTGLQRSKEITDRLIENSINAYRIIPRYKDFADMIKEIKDYNKFKKIISNDLKTQIKGI